jgi:flagellar basal-body rod protein FlgC
MSRATRMRMHKGYVAYPAINPVNRDGDLMGSVRSYQLNASAISAEKQMVQESIGILKTSKYGVAR